jgi:hypothetical protein
MRTHAVTIAFRILLGSIVVGAPVASALHLFPEPQLPPDAAAFVEALVTTGYMLPLIWATEVAAGLLLLLGWLVPLALLLLAPVVVHIIAFHVFLAPGGRWIAALIGALEIVLAWQHREAFAPLLGLVADDAEAGDTGERGGVRARQPGSLRPQPAREEG